MALKDMAILLDWSSRAASRYAISLASGFEAHLTVAAVVIDPTVGLGFTQGAAAFAASVLDKARDAARAAVGEIGSMAQRSGVSAEVELVEAASATLGDALGRLLRHFDLTIIEQPNPEVRDDKTTLIEAALFGSGRPLLLVPYVHQKPAHLQNVTVAWDASGAAARALGDAMPLLKGAKRIEIVTVGTPAGSDVDASAARITGHLGRHGLTAERRLLPDIDVASGLLSSAHNSGADLLVMGGYGHSRFRELVFGGATRGILQSMTVPVLMSH